MAIIITYINNGIIVENAYNSIAEINNRIAYVIDQLDFLGFNSSNELTALKLAVK